MAYGRTRVRLPTLAEIFLFATHVSQNSRIPNKNEIRQTGKTVNACKLLLLFSGL
jgi:hypothetical protein